MPSGWPESFTTNYSVPNNNPFVNTNGSVLEEYYALGFRQPYRFSRDPVTGLIWVADSGQSTRERGDHMIAAALCLAATVLAIGFSVFKGLY